MLVALGAWWQRNTFEALLALTFGLFFGAILVYAIGRLPPQWTLLLIAAAVGLSGMTLVAILFDGLKHLLFVGALFATPIFYDINFLFDENVPFFVSANGITISLFDLFFLPLLFYWFLQGVFLYPDRRAVSYVFDGVWLRALIAIFCFNLFSCLFVSPEPFFSFSMLLWNVKAALLFFYLANNIKTEAMIKLVVYTFSGCLILQGAVVLEQTFVGVIFTPENLGRETSIVSLVGLNRVERMAGTLGHPNDLAMYVNLLLPMVCFFFLYEKSTAGRLLIFTAIGFGVLTELATASRGGWVGLLIAMVLTIFLLLKKRGVNLVVVSAITAFVVGMMVLLLFIGSEAFRSRLTEDDHGTADLRYPLMDVAWSMIADNPFWGVGLNTYTVTMQFYDRTAESVASLYPYPVHNTYLLIAAESGLPLVLALFGFIFLCLYRTYRVFLLSSGAAEYLALGLIGGVITWMVHNLVNLDAIYTNNTLWILLGLMAALELTWRNHSAGQPPAGGLRR